MEDVLEVYRRPYDERFPVICMDEQPVQLVAELRTPTPVEPGKPARFDYQYERNGTTNIFMFCEPLHGWREPHVVRRKTAVDWAAEIRWLLEKQYPHAEKVVLVCDNLSTHHTGALYEAFPPDIARRLVERLEIHYTPKHGSWLNIAEIELSVLTRQCLKRRIASEDTLTKEVDAWQKQRNAHQKGVSWQFSAPDARIKLKRLYPQIQS